MAEQRKESEDNLRPKWITRELVLETLRVFNPRYQGKLTEQCAVEILKNTARLVRMSTWMRVDLEAV